MSWTQEFLFFLNYFFFLWLYLWHMEVLARDGIGAAAASLCHSHSKVGSELHL